MVTVRILKETNRNYENLFRQIDKSMLFGRDGDSLSETDGPNNSYDVSFHSLPTSVLTWLAQHPVFEIISDR